MAPWIRHFHSFVFTYLFFYIVDEDECASAPCRNGGTCVDGIDTYFCRCTEGFGGRNCETSECRDWLFRRKHCSFSTVDWTSFIFGLLKVFLFSRLSVPTGCSFRAGRFRKCG